MREIKFRTYNKRTRVMDYNPDYNSQSEKINDSFDWDDNIIEMQFTGLLDENEIDIYEGDIIGYSFSNGFAWGTDSFLGEIQFKVGSYGIYIPERNKFLPITFDNMGKLDKADEFKVVGNVYEDSELLKQDY